MTTKTTPIAFVDLAAAGQQVLLDTLMVEIGVLKAIMPGHSPRPGNGLSPDAARREHDAALDALFENMPV